MTLKNTVTPYMVPEEQRKANSRAQAKRDAWRRRYAMISKAIRETKKDMNSPDYTICYHYQMQVQLDALRASARALMEQRDQLGQILRETSYTYMPRNQLEAAKRVALWG